MNKSSYLYSSTLAIVCGFFATSASAFTLGPGNSYVGEDINLAGINAAPALISFPNSQAAATNFLGVLSTGIAVQNFDSFTSLPSEVIFPTPTGNIMAKFSGLVGLGTNLPGHPTDTNFGAYATSPSNYLNTRAEQGSTNAFRISFFDKDNNPASIAALGFAATDLGDFGAQLDLQFSKGGAPVGNKIIPITTGDSGSTSGSVAFAGVLSEGTSEEFDSVLFETNIVNPNQSLSYDNFAFDDFVIAVAEQIGPPIPPQPPGTTTPEPSALIGVGLLGTIGFISRRRKK